jgi:hypothetical protein
VRSPIKDPKRVDLTDPREVEEWAMLLQVSQAQLREAVAAVGNMSISVAAHFARSKRQERQQESSAPSTVVRDSEEIRRT